MDSTPVNAGSHQESVWDTSMSNSSSMPVSFELVLTDDLRNGPYGEIGPMAGKLYVAPGSNYDAVAAALQAAWIKSRGDMMNMAFSQKNVFGGKAGGSTYHEDWRVCSIDYKGGSVAKEAQAVAGTHNAKLGITQTVALDDGGCGNTCVIL
jgi:hypothetical protein